MVNLDLSGLPKKKHVGKECISWKETIGHTVSFTYNNIVGTILINNYNINNRMLTITYDGFQSMISTSCFLSGAGLKKIINKGSYVVKGINDFNTKFPNLIKYLANPVDGEQATYGSKKKIKCKCPTCGFEKEIIIQNLGNHGFSCNQCGDGFSYPSKVITTLLKQICVEYICEYIPDWSDEKKYDHYIPSLNMIIEEHGRQHYEDTIWNSYEEQHTIDLQKEKIAKENGITHYIQLDCRKSNINFIRKSINKSNIPSLLNFKDSDIDWENIDYIASNSSMFKIVCNEWSSQNNKITTSIIAQKLNLGVSTVTRYLKRGNELGLIHYNPQEEIMKKINRYKKPVTQYDLNGNKITTYASAKDASIIVGVRASCITGACWGKSKTSGGFMWSYGDADTIPPLKNKRVPLKNKRGISIIQYSLDGVEIATYESVSKVVKTLHISASSICNACTGRSKTAGGFIWRYAEEELNPIEVHSILKNRKPPISTKPKSVIQYSLNGIKIATYESVREASRTLHIQASNISAACIGKRKTAGGFIWKYIDESELIA